MLLRRRLRVFHRWLSLLLGGLFALTSLTGGVLVFGPSIDRYLNPELFQRSGEQDIGINAVCAIVSRANPDQSLGNVWLPRKHGVYKVMLADRTTTLFIDPSSGQVLGSRQADHSVIGWLTELHVSLFAGSVGESIVGLSAIPLLLVLASGAVLWWPGWRRIKLGLRIRRSKGALALVYDAHKAAGIVGLPLLALIAVTGFLLTFSSVARPLVHALVWSDELAYPQAKDLRCLPQGRQRLDPHSLCRLARQAVPDADVALLAYPSDVNSAVQVRLRTAHSSHPSGSARVWLDPHSGRILHRHDPVQFNAGNRLYAEWMFPLHIGAYGGVTSQVVHAVIALIPAFLLATGSMIWWRRPAKRRRDSAR